MKKWLFFTGVVLFLLFGIYAEALWSWSSRILASHATRYSMAKSDYLTMLSRHYYGTPKYRAELALVNRTPDVDRILPGQRMIIPGVAAIEELHRTHSLRMLNQIVRDKHSWLAEHTVEPVVYVKTEQPS
jgi:hypothetical protein